MFDALTAKGFQIRFVSHAEAILLHDFPGIAEELEAAMLDATIPIEEIIAGGGGEAKGTQRLRRALMAAGWPKLTFRIERRINDVPRESQSHMIDHVRTIQGNSRIALEIEWNNKDPFFDRDLDNFKRLHADGAISIGVIVTRGQSLQEGLRGLVRRFLDEYQISELRDLERWRYRATTRQREMLVRRMGRAKQTSFRDAFTDLFVSDKFGVATTHWSKLDDRIQRGVGNPCPLVLIGLPSSIVTFGEGDRALAEIARADATEDE